MGMAEITKMSSRGQIVVPRALRERLRLSEGDTFAVFASDDMLLLKKIEMPSAEEAFDKLHEWGVAHAKKNRLKQEDVIKKIHKGRGIRKVKS